MHQLCRELGDLAVQALECLENDGAASEAATSAVLVLEVDPI